MSARNGWLGASVAVAIVAASALVLFGVAMREASSEHVDEWRMQAMSTRQAQALWRLRIAETFGNDAARLALAQVLVSDADPQRVRRGVALLRRVADGGDARAQLQLGKILLKGLPCVGVDHTESREWLLKAAAAATRHAANTGEESPDPDNAPAGYAAFYLASIYRNGYGVAPDPRAAFEWLERAANAGVPQAQFQLANVYRQDGVVRRDDTRALHWLVRAGKAELAEANLALAIAYRNGELGLKPDEDEYWSYVKETAHDYKHTIVP
jgi:TPR repeat protein